MLTIRKDLYNKDDKENGSKFQAVRVFNLINNELQSDKTLKIALLYAANNQQATNFYESYRQGLLYIPEGSGQARFFNSFNRFLNDAIRRGEIEKDRIRVLPISTSLRGGDNSLGNQVSKEELDRDLKFVEDHLKAGYCVYGFPAQNASQYAIGGGVSAGFYSIKPPYPNIEGKSQGEYVQNKLKSFEKIYNNQQNKRNKPSIKGNPAEVKSEEDKKSNLTPSPIDDNNHKINKVLLFVAGVLIAATGIYLQSMVLTAIGAAALLLDIYIHVKEESSARMQPR